MAVYYFFMTVIGAAVPLVRLIPWVVDHGLDVPLMLRELFSTRIGGFFGLDVLLSAVTLIAFIRRERHGIRAWWLPVTATCLIGVSCGLPLFLYLRERQRTMRVI